MNIVTGLVAVLAALASTALQAQTQQDAEIRQLREELRQLKQGYEERLRALEQRLQKAETSAAPPASLPTSPPAPPQAGASQGENAFNPAISLILNGTLASTSRDPASYRINGFVPSNGEVAPPRRSASLGESELNISANVDHLFRGAFIAAVTPDNNIEVEEAYVQTLALPRGFTLKAGRFLSSVGYLNETHPHAWDFADASLVNKAFLGNQFNDDGLQLRWVAPTELFVELGAEAGRGRKFPAGPEGGASRNGFGAANLFARLGGDVGSGGAWRAGLSYLRASPRARTYQDADSTGATVANSFDGHSGLWALDCLYKWAPNYNAAETSFKLQGEYFRRTENGTLAYDTQSLSQGAQSGAYRSAQSGWYLQGVYQFAPQWRAGYRYDRLNAGSTNIGLVQSGALTAADFPLLAPYDPKRSTFMVDWSPSEFSRLRLQLARDYSRMGEPDNQIFLQYIMSLGAHGAHKF